MQQFERHYADMIGYILSNGERRQTRNGETISLFGDMLTVPINGTNSFPILQGRKMYPQGVFGELAAMLRKPTNIYDFRTWGCNYWDQWAKEDGSINVDYGNAWHADDQIKKLKHALAYDPMNRRMIINGWRPEKLDELDLPCCHMMYQFYVRDGKYLDMLWTQRSVDMMIGLPSDIVFAAAWLIAIANEFSLQPGEIKMSLGDCHIYAEHYEAALQYIKKVCCSPLPGNAPTYRLTSKPGKDFCMFKPSDIALSVYQSHAKLDLELKA
jgi:thymidylate synthase